MKIHQAKDLKVGDIIWKNNDRKFLIKEIKQEPPTKYITIKIKKLFESRESFYKTMCFDNKLDCFCERKEETFDFEIYL